MAFSSRRTALTWQDVEVEGGKEDAGGVIKEGDVEEDAVAAAAAGLGTPVVLFCTFEGSLTVLTHTLPSPVLLI